MENNASFVRTQMLPPQAPPVSEAGAVKWLRENLFSGWFNTILTLLGLWVIFKLVTSAAPWWLNSVWNAESLSQCREIVAAAAANVAVTFLKGETPEAKTTLYDTPSELFVPAVVTAENIKAEIFDKGINTPEEVCTGEYAEGCKALGITQ